MIQLMSGAKLVRHIADSQGHGVGARMSSTMPFCSKCYAGNIIVITTDGASAGTQNSSSCNDFGMSRIGTFQTGANFRFGQEHRAFLTVNEFHYLTRCGPSSDVS
jgi:hypothetical protein